MIHYGVSQMVTNVKIALKEHNYARVLIHIFVEESVKVSAERDFNLIVNISIWNMSTQISDQTMWD